jgi:group I intron endonuclease
MAAQFFASTTELVQWRGGFWASPNNLPSPKPGVYLIQHVQSGKGYIGISQNITKRLGNHAHGTRSSPKLANTVRKYGTDAFAAIPLYYSLDGTTDLANLEATLINEFDSVKNGYNTKLAEGRVGPYGPAFGAIMKAVLAKPEVKAKQRAYWDDPIAKAKQVIRLRELAQDPEVKAKKSTAALQSWIDPESRSKRIIGLRDAWQRPGMREKQDGAKRRKRTACRNGHPYTEETTIISATGQRFCRTCRKLAYKRNQARDALAQTLKRRAGRTAEEMQELHRQHLRHLADANRGKPCSAETRAKISAAAKHRALNRK